MSDLKEFRKANGLTQATVAQYLEVSEPFISQIEKGKNKLPDDKLEKLKSNKMGWVITSLESPQEKFVQAKNSRGNFTLTYRHHHGKSDDQEPNKKTRSEIIASLLEQNEKLKAELEELKAQLEKSELERQEFWELIKKLHDK